MMMSPEQRAKDLKTPLPAFSDVQLTTPYGSEVLRIPAAPSRQFRTAADVLRGAERAMDVGLARVREHLKTFNQTGRESRG